MNNKSWRTTGIGVALIILGAWAFKVHWDSAQSIYFNLVMVEPPQLAIIAAGWLGLHARDHKCEK
jgi:hypothetical protein